MEVKNREHYLSNIKVGDTIAYRDAYNKMYSGKVREINGDDIKVQTKNGSIYFIKKTDVTWVKNGTHWPVGIMNALTDSMK